VGRSAKSAGLVTSPAPLTGAGTYLTPIPSPIPTFAAKVLPLAWPGEASISGPSPRRDGEINRYCLLGGYSGFGPQNLRREPRRDATYEVLFVNGIKTDPAQHKRDAGAIAVVTGGAVKGVYNATSGILADLGQCIQDKFTFSNRIKEIIQSPPAELAKMTVPARIRAWLTSRNAATAELFWYLADRKVCNHVWLVAHSQGNLVACVALLALEAMTCAQDVANLVKVCSIASPVCIWPDGVHRVPFDFYEDPIVKLGCDLPHDHYPRNYISDTRKIINAAGKTFIMSTEAFVLFHVGLVPQSVKIAETGLTSFGAAASDVAFESHDLFAYLSYFWNKGLVALFP
jgi:hypothetical protein